METEVVQALVESGSVGALVVGAYLLLRMQMSRIERELSKHGERLARLEAAAEAAAQ